MPSRLSREGEASGEGGSADGGIFSKVGGDCGRGRNGALSL